MMKGWEEQPISSLGQIITGKTPPKVEPEYWNGDELFVSPKDMERDSFYIKETQSHITKKALGKFKTQSLPKNSVMYTSLSYGFGKIGLSFQRLLTNQQITSVVVNNINDYRFVYYLLRVSTPHIFAYNSGIDTPIVPKSVFEKIKLPLPPLPIQKKIAAILSAYDELIENNNRRIAILERMAEEIYREWFVRMRFPGHEKVKMVKGVPEGWEVKKLGEILELQYGKGLKEDDRTGYGYPVFGSSGIVGYHREYLVKGPSIVVGRKGNVGSIFWTEKNFFPIDTVYFVVSKIQMHFLYYLLRNMNFINNDAAVPGLNRNQAYSNKFYLPNANLINLFSLKIKTIFDQIFTLRNAIVYLKKSRDLLLPRLISGTLDVEKLDITFPPGLALSEAKGMKETNALTKQKKITPERI